MKILRATISTLFVWLIGLEYIVLIALYSKLWGKVKLTEVDATN